MFGSHSYIYLWWPLPSIKVIIMIFCEFWSFWPCVTSNDPPDHFYVNNFCRGSQACSYTWVTWPCYITWGSWIFFSWKWPFWPLWPLRNLDRGQRSLGILPMTNGHSGKGIEIRSIGYELRSFEVLTERRTQEKQYIAVRNGYVKKKETVRK